MKPTKSVAGVAGSSQTVNQFVRARARYRRSGGRTVRQTTVAPVLYLDAETQVLAAAEQVVGRLKAGHTLATVEVLDTRVGELLLAQLRAKIDQGVITKQQVSGVVTRVKSVSAQAASAPVAQAQVVRTAEALQAVADEFVAGYLKLEVAAQRAQITQLKTDDADLYAEVIRQLTHHQVKRIVGDIVAAAPEARGDVLAALQKSRPELHSRVLEELQLALGEEAVEPVIAVVPASPIATPVIVLPEPVISIVGNNSEVSKPVPSPIAFDDGDD